MANDKQYITLKDLAEKLGVDHSNLRKQVMATGLSFIKVKSPRGQPVLALSVEDAEAFTETRQTEITEEKRRKDTLGEFYAIRLIPEIPNRIKLGFAKSAKNRARGLKTANPTLTLLNAWPCLESWECRVMDDVTESGCTRIGKEVFDFEDVDRLLRKIDDVFRTLPIPEEVERRIGMRMKGIYLTEQEWSALDSLAEETGLSVSELVRRAVDEYIDKEKEKKRRREEQ